MIKIQVGQHGYFLKVDGYCIKRNLNDIKITKIDKANNWYATEFASIEILRDFWRQYRILIQFSIINKIN